MGYTWYDFLGNVGVFLLLAAYLLLQLNKINSNQISYSLMNAIGAALILVSLIFEFNLSAFAIEFFWLLISLVGIVSYYRTKAKPLAQQDSD
jgi:Ca2+-dependent lipid-binding protein